MRLFYRHCKNCPEVCEAVAEFIPIFSPNHLFLDQNAPLFCGAKTEIWAKGVQWGIGNIRYPGYRPSYFGEYTGLIEDHVDPANASGHDRVGGYTLLQIERVLGPCDIYNDLKRELRDRDENNKESNLPALFTFWL